MFTRRPGEETARQSDTNRRNRICQGQEARTHRALSGNKKEFQLSVDDKEGSRKTSLGWGRNQDAGFVSPVQECGLLLMVGAIEALSRDAIGSQSYFKRFVWNQGNHLYGQGPNPSGRRGDPNQVRAVRLNRKAPTGEKVTGRSDKTWMQVKKRD